MIDAGILDGDFVVARAQTTADNGDIVVAGIPGEEATVKTFQRKGVDGHADPGQPAARSRWCSTPIRCRSSAGSSPSCAASESDRRSAVRHRPSPAASTVDARPAPVGGAVGGGASVGGANPARRLRRAVRTAVARWARHRRRQRLGGARRRYRGGGAAGGGAGGAVGARRLPAAVARSGCRHRRCRVGARRSPSSMNSTTERPRRRARPRRRSRQQVAVVFRVLADRRWRSRCRRTRRPVDRCPASSIFTRADPRADEAAGVVRRRGASLQVDLVAVAVDQRQRHLRAACRRHGRSRRRWLRSRRRGRRACPWSRCRS